MNGFDVRAIGWVVTRDACAEIARALVGARRQMTPEVLQSLGDRWLAACDCLREDKGAARGDVLAPLGTAPLPNGKKSMDEFVLQMVSCCPERYSEPVLRGRCFSAAAQAFVGIVGCIGAGSLANPDRMLFGDIAVILLVMACFSLVNTIQLWITHRVVKSLDRCRGIATGTTRAVIE